MRKSNQVVCSDFRRLLTHGAKEMNVPMEATKAWRNELWKAFREIEDRLCPLEAMERGKNEKANKQD